MRRPKVPGAVVGLSFAVALLLGLSNAGPASAQQRGVVVVGDSVILGAESAMTAAFAEQGWSMNFDAQVNRSTAAGGDVIVARAAELSDTLVVNLGANDAGNTGAYRSRVEQILASTAAVPHVYWLTIHEVRDYYPAANQALRDAAAAYPNVTVLDWHAVAAGRGDLTASDGLHLNGAGATEMTNLVMFAALTGLAPGVIPPPPPQEPLPPATVAAPPPPPPVPATDALPPVTAAPTTLAPTTLAPTTVATTTSLDGATRQRAAADEMAIVGRTIDYGNVFSWTFGAGFAVVVALLAVGGAGIGGWALIGTRARPLRPDSIESSPSPSPQSPPQSQSSTSQSSTPQAAAVAESES